jgi:hypothetical protein
MQQWQAVEAFRTRDGFIILSGGNLLLERTDLTIETRLGTQAIGQSYNSATGKWTWTFDMSYLAGTFTDQTGAVYSIGAQNPGPIPGTAWKKVDEATIETRGGLQYSFGSDGTLARIAWRQASYPDIEYRRPSGGELDIVQCTNATTCSPGFTVYADQPGAVSRIVDRAGRVCQFTWAMGQLHTATCQHDTDNSLPGTEYIFYFAPGGSPIQQLDVKNSEGEVVRYQFDSVGRTTSVQEIGEGSPTFGFAYSAVPVTTTVTDPLSRQTVHTFDSSTRLLSSNNASVGETQ